jgi:hypothetical protein
MRALVIFESMFGNTQVIASSIAEGLAPHMQVDLVEVGAAPTEIDGDVGLLVVGGPTHAFGMSRPGTRQSAAQQSERGVVSARIGLREWLGGLSEIPGRVAVATFDTRIAKPRLPGSAAAAAEKRLRRLGFRFIPSKSFYVEGTTGSLVDGEPERARRWGTSLGRRSAPSSDGTETPSEPKAAGSKLQCDLAVGGGYLSPGPSESPEVSLGAGGCAGPVRSAGRRG